MDKFKNLVRKLGTTGFFHIFGSSTLNKIISFMTSIVLVRVLTKSEYGVFTYVWNIYGIVQLLNGMGMGSSALQIGSECNDSEVQINSTFDYCKKIGIRFNFLLMLVILLIALFAPLEIQGASNLFFLLLFLPIIQFLYELDLVYFRVNKMNKQYSKMSLLNTVLIFVGSVIGAFIFKEKGMILGYYVAYTCSILVYKRFVCIDNKSPESTARLPKKEIISIGIVSMSNIAISQLLYLLDVFVLGIIISDETVLAGYKVATIIPSALVFIPQALITYIYPYFASHNNDGEWCLKQYKKILTGIGLVNSVISISLFSLAPFIITVMFGAQYIDDLIVFRLLAINYFFSGTFRLISGNLLVTQKKLKFNFMVALSSGIINVIADVVLIRKYGSVGAAIATIIVVLFTSVVSTTYLLITFRKKVDK